MWNTTASLQKIATYANESNERKPEVIAVGHFHKNAYTKVAGIHCVHSGSLTQPSPFMYGQQLRSCLCAYVLEFSFTEGGQIIGFNNKLYDYDYAYDPKYGEGHRPAWRHKGF